MAGNPVDTAYHDAVAVTPSDTKTYDPPLKALFVGGAGNIAVVTQAGNAGTLTGVLAGSTIALSVSQVKATGTTATNITGLL